MASISALTLMSAVGPAFAADAPTRIPVKAPAYHYNWNGFYAGANYGTALSQSRFRTTNVTGESGVADASLSVGLQAGFNWHYHPNWVAGIEADISWLDIDRTITDFTTPPGVLFGAKSDWYGTLRGRLGYTSSPSLFYVTGGAAFVQVKNLVDLSPRGGTNLSASETATGWTAGFGTEVALGGGWSAKAEYLYIDAGEQHIFDPVFQGGDTTTIKNRFHTFRKGLNYRFGGPDVPAAAIPKYNWAGFYGGFFGGVAAAQVSMKQVSGVSLAGAEDFDPAALGPTGGMQFGYNWYFTRDWVAGVEGDIGWLGLDHVHEGWNDPRLGVKTGWYGTLRGRVGISAGQALLYGTGGLAVVRVKNVFDAAVPASSSEAAVGWTIGGGIEATLGNQWTAKTEYLMIDAGQQDVFNPTFQAPGTGLRYDNLFHVFRFGVNRKFGT